MTAALVAVPTAAVRARRCPRAILGLWVWEAVMAWILAWPFVSVVRIAYGTHPRTDAGLWEPGGYVLLDLLQRRLPVAPSLVAHVAGVTVVSMVVALLPSAAALAALGYRADGQTRLPLGRSLQVAARAFVPSLLVLMGMVALELGVLLLGGVSSSFLLEGLSPKLGFEGAAAVAASVAALALSCAALVGVQADLARAAVVRLGEGAEGAVRAALAATARAPGRVIWAWAWRAAAGLVPVAFGALLAERAGGRGGAALVALLLIHQVVTLVRVAFRTSWMANAIRAVDPPRKRTKL